ncbi:MAG: hypothetical protein CL912_27720 [Deltaproteobacteria bacterium]|nr:hypothetical protein [Deltaproteobacteria bacterium]
MEYAINRYQTEVSHLPSPLVPLVPLFPYLFPPPLLSPHLSPPHLNSTKSPSSQQTKRLYSVLEHRLAQQKSANHTAAGTQASTAGGDKKKAEGGGPWIVGDKLTIADIACFSWVNWAEWAGVSLDEFP